MCGLDVGIGEAGMSTEQAVKSLGTQCSKSSHVPDRGGGGGVGGGGGGGCRRHEGDGRSLRLKSVQCRAASCPPLRPGQKNGLSSLFISIRSCPTTLVC